MGQITTIWKMCLCSVLDWCSQSWVQLNSELWRRLVPRWQHWPLRSCRRWEMTDGKTTLASGTFYHAAVWFLLVPLWLSFLIITPGVCVSWRFLRICKLLAKRWGIKCHVAHITFPCSSNWRGRKMFLGSVSSAFCSSPLCFCYPTGFTVSCIHAQLCRRKTVLASLRANCSEHSPWRLSTTAGRTEAKSVICL